MLQTYYEFCGDHLIIRCRLFSRKVHIDDIKIAEPTRTVVASIVLSLCRVAISTQSDRRIMVSHRDKERFLNSYPKKGPRGAQTAMRGQGNYLANSG